MNKLKLAIAAMAMLTIQSAHAGGILTNTNQSIQFLRNPARDAAIGIDGVYFNPAGVAFLSEGLHLSLNLQNATQTRSVTGIFAPFVFGAKNESTTKTFKGEANAPVLPTIQAAYNKDNWSFQFGFGILGGGGKCIFKNGLPSFESTVAMLPLLSQNLDAVTNKLGLGSLGLPAVDSYDMDTYMRGRQYYFGFTFGAAYKFNEHWSAYGGLRMLYGNSNYYGYVSNIKARFAGSNEYVNASETFLGQSSQAYEAVGRYTAAAQYAAQKGDMAGAQAAQAKAQEYAVKAAMLGALGNATQDVRLNCDQTGWGVAPILGVDYKVGDFNFAAKYEFKTRMRLKNKAANSESARNLEILDRWADKENVPEDSPALLTLGARWSVIPSLRLNAGWHHYFDKDAHQYKNHQKRLGGNTNEFLFGAEYDVSKMVEVSAGVQKTNYKMTGDYMEDVSFVVNSYSYGFGFGVHLNKKMTLNVAYFQTNYSDFTAASNNYNDLANLTGTIVKGMATRLGPSDEVAAGAAEEIKNMLTTPVTEDGKSLLYGKNTFTRTNHVFGLGLNIDF